MFRVDGGLHGDSLLRNQGEHRKKMLKWLEETLKD